MTVKMAEISTTHNHGDFKENHLGNRLHKLSKDFPLIPQHLIIEND
jgi:hypothetical protein